MISSDERRKIFDGIYRENLWQSAESRSGPGSTMEKTSALRMGLTDAIHELKVRSLVDAPCGDFNWMRHVRVDSYVGVDCVAAMIHTNSVAYGSDSRRFIVADIVTDVLPTADMILCRDCLPHLSLEEGKAAIAKFKESGSIYLAISTCHAATANPDSHTGACRPVNLLLEPFNFPDAVEWITEAQGYSIGIWKMVDLEAV